MRTYPLSHAQRAILRKIHAAGGVIASTAFAGRRFRSIAKLIELGLVVRDDSLPTHATIGLTAAGLGVAGNLAGEGAS